MNQKKSENFNLKWIDLDLNPGLNELYNMLYYYASKEEINSSGPVVLKDSLKIRNSQTFSSSSCDSNLILVKLYKIDENASFIGLCIELYN